MAVQDNTDVNYDEQPSTHKLKVQNFLIICGVLVSLGIVLTVLFSSEQKQPVEAEAAPKPKVQEDAAVVKSFEDRVNSLDTQRIEIKPDKPEQKPVEVKRVALTRQDVVQERQKISIVEDKKPYELKTEEVVYNSMRSRGSIGDNDAFYEDDKPTSNVRNQGPSLRPGPQVMGPAPVNDTLEQRLQEIRQQMQQVDDASLRLMFNSHDSGGPRACQSEASVNSEPTFLIPETTIIDAAITQDVVSDYPGPFRCLITNDVYDIDKENILIPKGAKCRGDVVRISNVNEPISARVGYVLHTIIMPNGSTVSLAKQSAVDRVGIAGMKDKVNYHFFAQFMGVLAYALVSSEAESSTSVAAANDLINQSYEDDVKESIREQFSPLAQKYLQIVPTITIRSGQPFKIFIEEELRLPAWRKLYDKFI